MPCKPVNNLMGQCLPSVQFHKRAFGIHIRKAFQQVRAPSKRLQLKSLHIQLEQRRPGNLFAAVRFYAKFLPNS